MPQRPCARSCSRREKSSRLQRRFRSRSMLDRFRPLIASTNHICAVRLAGYRSGLVLTSKFSGFGALSGLRLDSKGERFISFSDKGTWFTGRIVYQGRQMTGLADVMAASMLGPDGTPIAPHGWYDTESIARDAKWFTSASNASTRCCVDFGRDGVRAHGKPAVRLLTGESSNGTVQRGNHRKPY
jgi:hypothetical protein